MSRTIPKRAAALLAVGMAEVLPPWTEALVPVPRAVVRRWTYGVDPAATLSRAISRLTGLPVVAALRPVWWWSQHAGRPVAGRSSAAFRAGLAAPEGALLVDDVVTSGGTLAAAAVALGRPNLGAVTATSAL